jgi:hypothetical protein
MGDTMGGGNNGGSGQRSNADLGARPRDNFQYRGHLRNNSYSRLLPPLERNDMYVPVQHQQQQIGYNNQQQQYGNNNGQQTWQQRFSPNRNGGGNTYGRNQYGGNSNSHGYGTGNSNYNSSYGYRQSNSQNNNNGNWRNGSESSNGGYNNGPNSNGTNNNGFNNGLNSGFNNGNGYGSVESGNSMRPVVQQPMGINNPDMANANTPVNTQPVDIDRLAHQQEGAACSATQHGETRQRLGSKRGREGATNTGDVSPLRTRQRQ